MSKPKHPTGKARRGSSRSKESKFQKITGGEVHGRGGESLPSRERAMVGQEQDWERAENEPARVSGQRVGKARSGPRKNKIVEIEYERGPGSRFQIEGRGPRSKRQSKGD